MPLKFEVWQGPRPSWARAKDWRRPNMAQSSPSVWFCSVVHMTRGTRLVSSVLWRYAIQHVCPQAFNINLLTDLRFARMPSHDIHI